MSYFKLNVYFLKNTGLGNQKNLQKKSKKQKKEIVDVKGNFFFIVESFHYTASSLVISWPQQWFIYTITRSIICWSQIKASEEAVTCICM